MILGLTSCQRSDYVSTCSFLPNTPTANKICSPLETLELANVGRSYSELCQSRLHIGRDESAAAKLWAVYISEAEKYDKALVESYGLLIFVCIPVIIGLLATY
jgi:uncharacterized membrane protein